MRHPILILPFLLALGGCASSSGPAAFVSRADTSGAPETMPVAGADASMMLAQMPAPGGVVANVREKNYSNGLNQQAVLAGEVSGLGENRLEISVQTAAAVGPGSLNLSPPSEAGVKREILARYPKVPMRIVTQPRQNALGVFGLAIGRAPSGARCVFAWQWVDDIHRGANSDSGFSILGKRFGGSTTAGAPASIRVHLCRKDATVDDLAATVEGMTLAAPAIVARALDPARRVEATTPVRGVAGGNVVIASSAPEGSLESALGPQRPVAVAQAAPKARRATRVARRKPPVEAGDEGVVVARQAPVAEQTYAGGPRYLAPVAGMPASPPVVYNNPAPVASAAPSTAGLDPSLPAAAYRGPSSRSY